MKPELKRKGRRVTAGFLAFAMMAVLALGDAGASFASESERLLEQLTGKKEAGGYEKATASEASVRERSSDVIMNVCADETSEFYAGGTVSLDVRIKNDTDGMIDGGMLTLWANGIAEDSLQIEMSESEEEGEAAEIADGFVLTNDLTDDNEEALSYATPSDVERWGEKEDVVSRTIEGIHMNPGQVCTAHLSFDIDENEENKKVQSVKLRFQGQGEQKKVRVEDSFDYTVNGMNLNEIAFADENRAKPGSVVTMGIHAELFDEHVLIEDGQELLQEMARATSSDMERVASSSDAELTATPSDAEAGGTEDGIVELQAAGAAYEIEIHNMKLKNFEIERASAKGEEEKDLICSFEIPEKTAPGVYFGKVTQTFTKNHFDSRSTQGFVLVVEPEGQVILESSLGDELVTVSGPAEAFPEADQLAIKVSEPDEEQLAMAEEAMQKLLDEGEDISGYRAVDIKLYADGAEAEPEGSVQVTFSNMFRGTVSVLTLESEEEAEAGRTEERAEERTGEEAEEETEEQIRIFHLDEESGIAREVTSETQENGDVVMETDHFSTWIGVRSLTKDAKSNSGIYGYVSKLELTDFITGTAPFDSNDAPGNDSSSSNRIIRSFDDISYELAVSMHPVDGGSENSYKTGTLYLEAELPMDITKAKFDLDKMKWLEEYTISYYDEQGELIKEGKNAEPDYKANDKAAGSNQGTKSYQTAVAKQVLRGFYTLAGETSDSEVIPGTKSLSIGIQVLAAANQDLVKPSFKVWVGDNEQNYSAVSSSGEGSNPSECSITPEEAVVSAAARYNVLLRKTSQMNYLGNFDLKTGKEVNAANENSLHGRIVGYGVTLQLYNELDKPKGSSASVADKKLKGIELPQGPIEFDLTLSEEIYLKGNKAETPEIGYTPILWDYNPNVSKNSGTWGRNLYWGGVSSTRYAFWNAPTNQHSSSTFKASDNACYKGGSWEVLKKEGYDYKEDSAAVNGTERTYRIRVSDYDFDLDQFIFPSNYIGSGGVNASFTSYVGCFSAGYFEVLVQYPTDIDGTTTLFVNACVNPQDDFSICSISGNDSVKEVYLNDNRVRGNVVLYAPGTMTKYNSFTKKSATTYDGSGFLGTNYWMGPNYDASCYAGDEIKIWGVAHYGTGGDGCITSENLLQKFDSAAFEIVDEPGYRGSGSITTSDLNGKVKFLYAADPDYPKGWDSNLPGMMKYMNEAQEEDLEYFDTLEDLKKAGYTCVAVLMEIRNASLRADSFAWCYIPVKVTQDKDHIGKTVCTVNTVRAWLDTAGAMTHTWSPAVSEEERGEYIRYSFNPHSDYSSGYVKCEFKDGNLESGTNKGGIRYGMSISLLGYNSHVNIISDQKTYDLDKSEREAKFTINQIGAEISSVNSGQTSSTQKQETDLTITASIETVNAKGKVSLSFLKGYQLEEWSEGGKGGVSFIGSSAGKTIEIPVASSAGSIKYVPVTYIDGSTGKEYTIQVGGLFQGDKIQFYYKGVTVGALLPNISFVTSIGNPGYENDAENNQEIPVSAAISGSSDNRGYDETKGNLSQISVAVVRLSASGVIKMVDKRVAELNEKLTYSIIYRNLGKTDLNNIYMYDILPYKGDFRNSSFEGTLQAESVNIYLEQPDSDETSSDDSKEANGTSSANSAEAELYFTSEDSETLGKMETEQGGIWESFTTFFSKKAGQTTNGELEYQISGSDSVTAIGLLINRLPAGKEIKVQIMVEPKGNRANDTYVNTARTWFGTLSETSDFESALVTNRVQTVIVSRELSGRVWHDVNWNGAYDNGEETLANVKVVLQKKENGKYSSCKNVLGENIEPVITGTDGTYLFKDLASGEYRVVFGGTVLETYIGETAYQADGIEGSANSDGTPLENEKEYRYRISRTEGKPDIEYLPADQMDVNMPYAVVDHMDLGLLKGAKLQLKKTVEVPEDMANEPAASPYKFLIRLTDEETGTEYTAVALENGDTSGVIEINDFWGKDSGFSGSRKFKVMEIVPMEYTMTGMSGELKVHDYKTDEADRLAGTANGSTVTVYPGDEIMITLTNTPEHSGYFHRTSSVTNVKAHGSGKFDQEKPYEEPHGRTSRSIPSSTQLLGAVVKGKDEEGEQRPEKGDDLYG